MRPIDAVHKVCPRAKASYLAAIENGDALFRKYGITTKLRLAHFLAQICHESGGLAIEYESGNYSAERLMEIFGVGRHSAKITEAEARKLARNGQAIFERVYGLGNPKKAKELGNTKPGDGYRYRGTGLMQTTGRYNFRTVGKKCGVDFEKHPDLVLSAEHALKPALVEWNAGKLNVAADRDDIVAITKRINGGTNGLADRRSWLAKLKKAISTVDLDDEQPPPPPDVEEPPPPQPDDPGPEPVPVSVKPPWHKKAWAAVKSKWTWIATGLFGGGITIGSVEINAETILAICVLLVVLGAGFLVYWFLIREKHTDG
jgi:putative chitinase